ncbi:MAG: ChaN family lipoprotein [Alphaproteobacteria bacterium]
MQKNKRQKNSNDLLRCLCCSVNLILLVLWAGSAVILNAGKLNAQSLPPALLADLESASLILIGEIHDNPDHHLVQAQIIEQFASDQSIIVLEMIAVDQQNKLDAFKGNAAAFEDYIAWNQSGWPDYKIYAPIFEAAFLNQAALAGGGMDIAAVRHVAKSGFDGLPDDLAQRFKTIIPTLDIQAPALLDLQFKAHCSMVPAAQLSGMVAAQYARDMQLAQAILNAEAADKIFVIAGRGHTGKDSIPKFIKSMRPDLDMISIALAETDEDQTSLGESHDHVMITPAPAGRPNPCDAFNRDSSHE